MDAISISGVAPPSSNHYQWTRSFDSWKPVLTKTVLMLDNKMS